MDMVMERAARLAAEAEDRPVADDLRDQGMRLAAAYLNGEQTNLLDLLKSRAAEEQMAIRTGTARSWARKSTSINISPPVPQSMRR